jgi:hypothetical protein
MLSTKRGDSAFGAMIGFCKVLVLLLWCASVGAWVSRDDFYHAWREKQTLTLTTDFVYTTFEANNEDAATCSPPQRPPCPIRQRTVAVCYNGEIRDFNSVAQHQVSTFLSADVCICM